MKKPGVLSAPIHSSLKTTKDKTVKRMNSATSSANLTASHAAAGEEKQPGCYHVKLINISFDN